jgi:hypothetical protein
VRWRHNTDQSVVVAKYRSLKSYRIDREDVPRVFDDCCIARLATLAKLPANADLSIFKTGVRRAAVIYLRNASEPAGNELRDDVAAIYKAASRRKYAELKFLLGGLSEPTRQSLSDRGSRFPSKAALPAPFTLGDPLLRNDACKTVVVLCQYGGRWAEGRKRSSGRRSRTWEPLLYAPVVQSHPQRRQHERTFVMWLQLAYLEAVGRAPALTASAERKGPFVRLTEKCLHLVGAPQPDAVGLVNDLGSIRTMQRARSLSGAKA